MADAQLCKIEGCDKAAKKRAMCPPHYNAWYRDEVKSADPRVCGVSGCDGKMHARGFCGRHAYKFKTHGDPLGGRRGASPGAPMRWIQENANYAGDDCLVWPFEVHTTGYGVVKESGRRRVASRVMCEVAHGPPPSEGFEAAHSCGNGHLACMNPRHLRWATRAENIEDTKAHGTFARGQLAKSNGMTEEIVREIRSLAGTMLQREIADRFGLRECYVNRIIKRRRFAWVE